MTTHCNICGIRKEDDEYVSCPAHSFGEVETKDTPAEDLLDDNK